MTPHAACSAPDLELLERVGVGGHVHGEGS